MTFAIALFSSLILTGRGVFAQEATDSLIPAESVSPEPASAEEGADLGDAGSFHIGSDPTIWVLIALFNLGAAIAIERSWILYKNRGKNSELVSLLTERLHESASSDSLSRDIVKGYGLEGRVASVTLKGWNHGVHAMAEYAQTALTAERKNLERRMVILSTLGANTPFIGLLGTVLGIMKAFRDLAVMGDAGPTVVMKGISEALIATAAGLAVAIPCVIAYNLLSRAIKTKLANADEIVSLLRAFRITVFHPGGHAHPLLHAEMKRSVQTGEPSNGNYDNAMRSDPLYEK